MRTGNQEPTFTVISEYDYSYGNEVCEMFEEDGGATFYPSQKMELETMLARNRDGSPSALTIGISKPRQNGKSYSARYYAVYMSVFEHRAVLYSAHHSTTTNKMFKALCNLFESPEKYPDFANDVKKVSHVRGYEGIYFKDWIDEDGRFRDGGCIEFSTRTNSGARGGTYSVIVIDEAQELTKDQQEAMLPVMSAAADVSDKTMMPQQIFVGTPPSPTCHGTVFAEMHRVAHSNEEKTAWWLEWSVESENIEEDLSSPDKALELAYETNPAMGYRIAEKTILNEFETMDIYGFARERLGWWSPKKEAEEVQLAINQEQWMACKSKKMKPEGKTAYGVKFSADGNVVCLAGAVIDSENKSRISLIDIKSTTEGIRWLADWLNQRSKVACCVVIDGKNGVDVLIDKISDVWRAKNSIIKATYKDVLASVGTIVNEINEESLTWYEKQDILNESAMTTTKRIIGQGWGFGGENATPLEACALALWGVRNSKRNPSKTMKIG